MRTEEHSTVMPRTSHLLQIISINSPLPMGASSHPGGGMVEELWRTRRIRSYSLAAETDWDSAEWHGQTLLQGISIPLLYLC